MRRATFVAALALVLSCMASPARGESTSRWWVQLPRATSGLQEAKSGALAPPPNARALERRARRGRPDVVDALQFGPRADAVARLRSTGAKVLTLSRWRSAASVEVDETQLDALRREFGAAALRPVGVRRFGLEEPQIGFAPRRTPSLQPSAFDLAYGPSADQLIQVQVERLHALGLSGRGVRILVLDTGFVRSHSAFDSLEIVDAWDFVFDDAVVENEAIDPLGQQNHGTGVLAVMAGRQEGELVGPAFGAEVLLAKTEYVGSETRAEEDDFVAALEWGEALGADVATASLAYLAFPDDPDSFSYAYGDLDGDTAVTTRAVDDAVALGMIVTTAIGNRGPEPGSLLSPADSDSGLAVGAVRLDGETANFSSRGPTADGRIKPDLCARGVGAAWALAPEGYAVASGTSVATPIVAGVVALLLEAHPEWSPGDVNEALRSTATQSAMPDVDRGWGIVQAHDALFSQVPQTPLPFALVSPREGSHEATDTLVLRWRRAIDLQDFWLNYRVRAWRANAPGDTLLDASVGTDTLLAFAQAPHEEIAWQVTATDDDGHVRASAVGTFFAVAPVAVAGAAPRAPVRVDAPRPNPFNPRVSVRVEVERAGRLHATVYDAAGRRVRVLRRGERAEVGTLDLHWDGRQEDGREVAGGAYFLRLHHEGGTHGPWRLTRRMVLVR